MRYCEKLETGRWQETRPKHMHTKSTIHVVFKVLFSTDSSADRWSVNESLSTTLGEWCGDQPRHNKRWTCHSVTWGSVHLINRERSALNENNVRLCVCVCETMIAIKRLDEFLKNFAHTFLGAESRLSFFMGKIAKIVPKWLPFKVLKLR